MGREYGWRRLFEGVGVGVDNDGYRKEG